MEEINTDNHYADIMDRNEKPHISVGTVPNGYTLNVGNEEYLAFSVQQLLAEIYVHGMLGKTQPCNLKFIENLTEAAAAWPTASEQFEVNATLMVDKKEAMRETRELREQLLQKTDQLAVLRDEYAELKQRFADVCLVANKYANEKTKADNAYQLYNRECLRSDKLSKELSELKAVIANRDSSANARRKKRTREEILNDNLSSQSDSIAVAKRGRPKKNGETSKKPKKQATEPTVKRKSSRSRKQADAMVMAELIRQLQDSESNRDL